MRKAIPANLGNLLESFFDKKLVQQQNASDNTIASYRDLWRIFLNYLVEQKGIPVTRLTVDLVTAEIILDFLFHLEEKRKCSVRTRNQRRAAFRSFAKHAILYEPRYKDQFDRILAIPSKIQEKKLLGYLTNAEMDATLDACNRETPMGRRDYALLTLLYNTGARVSEMTAVKCVDVESAQITIHGKGNKERIVPIWPETVKVLKALMIEEKLQPKQHLFRNHRRKPIGRSGIAYILESAVYTASSECSSLQQKKVTPHTIRHTTAMHLLQSGTDMNLIRMWLGHVHLNTTHGYIEADVDMKRKALEKGGITKAKAGYTWKATDDVKAFLDTLGMK